MYGVIWSMRSVCIQEPSDLPQLLFGFEKRLKLIQPQKTFFVDFLTNSIAEGFRSFLGKIRWISKFDFCLAGKQLHCDHGTVHS